MESSRPWRVLGRIRMNGKLKPLARALRAPATVSRHGLSLSRAMEESLFRSADVLSEGGRRGGAEGNESYFGSTMISMDLSRMHEHWRGEFDDRARAQLADAVDGSVRMRLRAMRLACAEAARRVPDRALGTAQVEIRVRIAGEQLHMDIDLEVPLGVSSGSRPG